jgi:hypothetical protein
LIPVTGNIILRKLLKWIKPAKEIIHGRKGKTSGTNPGTRT